MSALLEIDNLGVEFHRDASVSRAVNGVSFAIEKGRSLGIVGESGSGKSVTVKAMMKLLPKYARINSGEVRFNGLNLLALAEGRIRALRGRHLAMVFQDPHAYLNPTKTVGAQLMEPLLFHRLAAKGQAKKKALELLHQVGIPSPELRFSQYPFEFSGGMLQRVTIAMALIAEPDVLIADEPTTSLDVTVQAQVLKLLRQIKEKRGMALIIVTHDLVVATQTCDDIVVMYGGTVVERLPSKRLLEQSIHPYTRGLIACTPRVKGDPVLPEPIPGHPLNLRNPLPPGCLFAERCSLRMARCESERPALIGMAADHQAACFLADSAPGGPGK